MDQDVQSRVEELEQNVQAKDRELAQSQQELRQKVYRMAQTYYFHKFRGLLFHTTYVCINACAEGMAPQIFCETAAIQKFTCAQAKTATL